MILGSEFKPVNALKRPKNMVAKKNTTTTKKHIIESKKNTDDTEYLPNILIFIFFII